MASEQNVIDNKARTSREEGSELMSTSDISNTSETQPSEKITNTQDEIRQDSHSMRGGSPRISLPPLASLTDLICSQNPKIPHLKELSGPATRPGFLTRSESESALNMKYSLGSKRDNNLPDSTGQRSEMRNAVSYKNNRPPERPPTRHDYYGRPPAHDSSPLPHALNTGRFYPYIEPRDKSYVTKAAFPDSPKYRRHLDLDHNSLQRFVHRHADMPDYRLSRTSYPEQVNQLTESYSGGKYAKPHLPELYSYDARSYAPKGGAVLSSTDASTRMDRGPRDGSKNCDRPYRYNSAPQPETYSDLQYHTLHRSPQHRNPDLVYPSNYKRYNSPLNVSVYDERPKPYAPTSLSAEPKMASAGDSKKRPNSSKTDDYVSSQGQPKYAKTTKATNRANNNANHICQACQATTTPEWRKGPTGPRTLCNACGLLYAKMCRKREQDAAAAAVACGSDPTAARKKVTDELLQPESREEILESLRSGVRAVASAKQHRMGLNPMGNSPNNTSDAVIKSPG